MAGMNCTSFRTTESKLICLERSTLLWHENQQALFFPLVWTFLTKAYLFYLIFLIHKPNATKHWLGVPYLTGTASQTGKYRIRGQQSPSCYSPSVPKCHLPVWQTFGWDWNEKKKKKNLPGIPCTWILRELTKHQPLQKAIKSSNPVNWHWQSGRLEGV